MITGNRFFSQITDWSASPLDVTATAVDIDGLIKRYGKTEAVSSLVLQVCAGTTFGLVGANGAGKPTLIKCLLAYCDFEEGHIAILWRAR